MRDGEDHSRGVPERTAPTHEEAQPRGPELGRGRPAAPGSIHSAGEGSAEDRASLSRNQAQQREVSPYGVDHATRQPGVVPYAPELVGAGASARAAVAEPGIQNVTLPKRMNIDESDPEYGPPPPPPKRMNIDDLVYARLRARILLEIRSRCRAIKADGTRCRHSQREWPQIPNGLCYSHRYWITLGHQTVSPNTIHVINTPPLVTPLESHSG